METCRVDGCDKPVKVKKFQLCVTHYHRFNRHGDPEAWRKKSRPICKVDDCDLRAVAHELCDMHYRRQKRYGTTTAPERPTVCAVEGCGEPVTAKALCDRHYRRESRGVMPSDRHCGWCGEPIDPNASSNRRFCSRTCLEHEHAVRRRENHRTIWLRQYGLTPETYAEMFAAQGDRCKICGTSEAPARGSFCVDHDHKTGKVRGILCSECNTGLGKFRDDPDLLRAAIAYLG